MSKTIAIHISFYNDRWEKVITEGIRALGYEPRFLNTDEVKLEDIADCEILFGMFPPELLAQCPNLRWMQCSFAGVDKYAKPGVFASSDVVLTNASGGINTEFSVGDIMLVEDHINFQGRIVLIGPNDDTLGPRFPDMTYAYDPELRAVATECADRLGIAIKRGVYISCTGPSYETPAEIRAFRILGADAVGMSTVPEVIAAVHCGYKVLTFSLITNMAAGITGNRLTMEEVAETGKRQSKVLGSLVGEVIKSC